MIAYKELTADEITADYLRLPVNAHIDDKIEFFLSGLLLHPRPEYLDRLTNKRFIVALADKEIVGAVELNKKRDEDVYAAMEFVSVNQKYQNQGIARELMRRAFALVSDCGDGKKLNLGGFTWDGEDYLRNIVKDGLQQYPGMLSAELEEIVTLQVFHC